MTFKLLRKLFPKAHPDWVIILVKANGQKNIKTKNQRKGIGNIYKWADVQTAMQAFQAKQA